MKETANNSEGTAMAENPSRPSQRSVISSASMVMIQSEFDTPAPAHAMETDNQGMNTDVATKIFRSRIEETLMAISDAVKEWNAGSTTWLNSVHRARDSLNALIRFDEY